MASDRPTLSYDLGGTTVSVGLVAADSRLQGAVVERALTSPSSLEAISADLATATANCLARAGIAEQSDACVAGVAGALPGPSDYHHGTSWMRHKLPALYGRTLATLIGLPDRPLAFINDAVAAALGEAVAGAARDCSRCLVLTLGTGLGSCYLEGGEPVEHGPGVPPGGQLWNQPFGGSPDTTVEDEVGAATLVERYGRLRGGEHRAPELVEIAERARRDDPVARAVFSHLAHSLAIGIAPSVRDFAPDRIILAGGVARSHQLFAPELEAALVDLVGGRPTPVVAAQLGAAAPLVGAARALAERVARFERRRVIFLHGFASSPGAYKAGRFVRALARHDVAVEVPALDEGDFRGVTLARHLALLDRLTAGQPPGSVLLVGSSFGAYAAALFAERSDRVAAMVLMAPAFDFARRWAERLGPEQMARWARDGEMLTMHFGSGREEPIAWGLITDARTQPPYPDVRVPTLVLHGDRDDVVPPESSRRFVAGRPNAELVVLDADHGLAEATEEILDRAIAFLAPWWH